MAQFEMGLPSVRQVQNLIKDRQEVELKLTTNDLLVGRVLWQDSQCICLVDRHDQPTLIWRQGLVYLKPKGS